MDILFINSSSALQAYQSLSENFSAIEPPTWSLLLAESCRSKNFSVSILDCDAEKLSHFESLRRIEEINPKLLLFVVYGQNPNSGTINMSGALSLANFIRENNKKIKIAFVGSHTSALPYEVLRNDCVDIILVNEGVYALHNLLRSNLDDDLKKIKGIGYKVGKEKKTLILNQPERIVPQHRMDIDLPGYAWDLLPYKKKPLDLYRAHFWHANFSYEKRTPFAAIYTSLGCNFACNFCMINIVNRVNHEDDIDASHFSGMRFWSPEWVSREISKLVKLDVRTLRISDEMFFLNRKFYEPILIDIVSKNYDLNMWAYSRVDTVKERYLDLFKRAGINWLALGIEAGNQTVRQEVSKGSFKEINIRDVCKKINSSNINIISNYIFGFPEDNFDTMNETLDLAIELNTEMANMYPCQALPGSPLYSDAKKNAIPLPESYEAFGFLSYECKPLPTKFLSSAEVLKFRDDAWIKYFTSTKYLKLVESKFGISQRENVESMTKHKLKRKILGD